MLVRYHNTPEHLVALTRYQGRLDRSRRLGFRLATLAAGLAILAITLGMDGAAWWASWPVGLLLLGYGLSALVLAPLFEDKGTLREVRRGWADGAGQLGEQQLELGQALVHRSARGERVVPWGEVLGADRYQGLVLIVLTDESAFAVPEGAFASPAEALAFARRAEALQEDPPSGALQQEDRGV
ncbi:MAG: hypothetical protein JXX28_07945 [Deltaproteobacteria bacterium]|nr:hypothetical protein [Deltaproteobacteria bacterium]